MPKDVDFSRAFSWDFVEAWHKARKWRKRRREKEQKAKNAKKTTKKQKQRQKRNASSKEGQQEQEKKREGCMRLLALFMQEDASSPQTEVSDEKTTREMELFIETGPPKSLLGDDVEEKMRGTG